MWRVLRWCLIVVCIFGWQTRVAAETLVEWEYSLGANFVGNALMGFVPSAESKQVSEDVSLVYVDVIWQELEPQEGQYAWESIESDNQFERWRQEGKHLVLRFVLDKPGKEAHMDIPQWLYQATNQSGDWYQTDYGQGFSPHYAHPVLIAAHQRAVAAMGERWGQDGLIAYIQLGSIGHWGEWHVHDDPSLERLPQESILDAYVAAWRQAFPQHQLLMRRPFHLAQVYQTGLYNDMVGEEGNTSRWMDWIRRGGRYDQTGEHNLVAMPDVWKRQAIGGELTSAYPMADLLNQRLATSLQHIEAAHMTFLGPKIADQDLNPAAYQAILSRLGYQLGTSQVRLLAEEGQFSMDMVWENHGQAPFYYDWPVKLYVEDGQGRAITQVTLGLQLHQLVPGKQVRERVTLDLGAVSTEQALSYHYFIGIVDPMTGRDAVRLAMPGYQAGSGRTRLFVED